MLSADALVQFRTLASPNVMDIAHSWSDQDTICGAPSRPMIMGLKLKATAKETMFWATAS